MPRQDLIAIRRGTAAQWVSANPVLASGEQGFETDTNKLKIGDGSTVWNSLDYITANSQSPATDTGTALDLSNYSGTYYNMSSADTNTTYTYTGEVLGGVAFKLINCASIPSVTGATRIFKGDAFKANKDMYLVTKYNGNRVEYWFDAVYENLEQYTGLPYGVVIAQSESPSTVFFASPDILKTSTERYIISHDIYNGDEAKSTKIYYSDSLSDNTWTLSETFNDMIWGTLFEYNDDVYCLGVSDYPTGGVIKISKSTDFGLTWSVPIQVLGIPATYEGWHTAPFKPFFKDGYLVRPFELRDTALGTQHAFNCAVLVFADLTDLTDSGNWSYSNVVNFNSTALQNSGIIDSGSGYKRPPIPANSNSKGFLEGCLVEKSDGDFINLLRLEQAEASNYAVYLDITWDDVTPTDSTLSSTHNFIEMPGGNVKSDVVFDSISGKHWAVTNYNRYKYYNDNRIEAYLISSDDDCETWNIHQRVLGWNPDINWEDDIIQYGVQYASIVIDGDNLLVVDRTANENAAKQHDANLITLTVIEDFRNNELTSFEDGSLIIDENSEILEDANGISIIRDQTKYANSPFMLNADNASKVSWSSGLNFTGSDYMRVIHDRNLNLDNNTGLSIFIVVENLQAISGGGRLLSKATGTGDNQATDYYYSVNVGLGIQDTRGVYTDITISNDYIFASSYDNLNEYLYNYLNGVNRGTPDSINDGSWNTDHIELGTTYTSGNFEELWIGDRQAGSSLPFDSKIKAIHIFPEYMTPAEMIAYMTALNSTYSIY